MQEAYENGLVVQPNPGSVPRLKRYLDEQEGVPITDVWTDIPPINSQAQERLGYPTQKPRALLERIIAASSNPGDTVLDPFCGCGTAVDAAQKLGLFITAAMPTKGVRDEIESHPLIETQWGRFPAMQVVTIAQFFHGPKAALPPLISPTKKAARVETRLSHQKGAQGELL